MNETTKIGSSTAHEAWGGCGEAMKGTVDVEIGKRLGICPPNIRKATTVRAKYV